MSDWNNQIKSHPIWTKLEQFGREVDVQIDQWGSDAAFKEGLLRLKEVLAFTGKRLELVPSHLLPFGVLTQLDERYSNAAGALVQLDNTGDLTHLHTANNELQAALIILSQIPISITSDEIGALRQSSDEYKKWMESVIAEAQIHRDQMIDSVTELRDNVKVLLSITDEKIASLKEEISTEKAQFNAEVATNKTRLDTIVTEHQSLFLTAQESRATEFNTLKAQWNQEFQHNLNHLQKVHDGAVLELQTSSAALVADMHRHREEIEKLVGIIGNLGMTSGFQKAATDAKNATRNWHRITVLSIIGLICFLGISIYETHLKPDFDWRQLPIRIAITAAFSVLAAYAAKQADRYLHIQNSNRRLELELEALGPYLAPLPDEEQNTFRLALAKKVFGRKDLDILRRGKSPATIVDLLTNDDVREFLEKAGPSLKELIPALGGNIPEIIKVITEKRAK